MHVDISDAWDNELALLSPEVRANAERLRTLLRDDFVEIGQSGRRWNRDEIIADLTTGPELAEPVISEQESRTIATGIVLVTYVLEMYGGISRRSSLWVRDGDTMRCFFHQGTPVVVRPS